MPPEQVTIRPIRDGDNLKKISLGNADLQPLKTFLKRDALQYESKGVARTYVVVDKVDEDQPGRVWGYLTLVASEVSTDGQNAPAVDHWPGEYSLPGVKVARMAVDQTLQGSGIGKALLSYAAGVAIDRVCPAVGCAVLVTDAKKSAVSFYERNGFRMLDTDANKAKDTPVMFIHLAKIV